MTCQENPLVVDFDPDRPAPVAARDPAAAGPGGGRPGNRGPNTNGAGGGERMAQVRRGAGAPRRARRAARRH